VTEPTVICPSCATEIKLTESLAAPLIESTRREFEARLAEKDAAVAKREAAVREQQKAVEEAKRSIDDQVAEKLRAERATIAAEEQKKAKLAASDDIAAKTRELAELQTVLAERDEKLRAAQQEQAELIKQKRELDDARRELELTVEKRVSASVEEIRQKAQADAEDALKLKVAEKDETITAMQRQIEDLKRRAEQGSQQLQGEVLEMALEATLRARFPLDSIEPVGKGEFGGDVLQRVVGPGGQACGAILWESKRTKNWSDGWLAKLRNDQRMAKAEMSVLVSLVMPKDVVAFGHVDGVWVVEPRYYVPLVVALRQSLIELAAARQSRDGQETKMELVYDYLTGPKFRQRVEAIVEKFSDMRADLDRERKVMTKNWAKREAQINSVIDSTVGMYGDLQGIAGRVMQEIEGLDVPLLSDGTSPGGAVED